MSIINSVNIELKNIKISNITKDTNTFFSEIADFYSLKYEDIIIHSLVASEPKTVFYVSNCEFLQADNIEITNSRLNDVINLHDTYQDINLKNLYQDSISANQYLNVVLSSDSNLTLQNITVFNSFFQDSIISLFSYSNISLDQISLQNTTAYSCIDSKFSWIFLNNFSAENLNLKSSALVMNPNSEISDFTIKNSLFSFIESDSAADIYINGKSDKKIIFMIKNTKFVSSQGKKLKSFSIAQNTEIVDGVFEHCEFRDMSLNNDVGVIGLFFVGQIRFISTVFQNIISLNRNSPIVYSEISLSSCSISNQTIEISNCLIKHNQISYFFVYDKQIISNDLKISNSEFYHNKGSLLYLTKSRVDIRDTEFKDNQGIGNYMIELHGTEISLLNTSFERNQGDALSGLLKSDMETQVYAEKVGIKDNNFEDTDLISS